MTCLICDANCATNQCAYNIGCTHCAESFYLKAANLCEICPANCGNCVDVLGCSICMVGYYLYNLQCYECPYYCQTCIDGSGCTFCYNPYILISNADLTLSYCERCPTGCSSCSSMSVCTSCYTHYYQNSNLCYECHQSCDNCTSASEYDCEGCALGYTYILANTCVRGCQ